MKRSEAVEFCKQRNSMHMSAAGEIERTTDLYNDEIALAKYNSRVNLADKYADIASLLERGESEWVWHEDLHVYRCKNCGALPAPRAGYMPDAETLRACYHYCTDCGAIISGVEEGDGNE